MAPTALSIPSSHHTLPRRHKQAKAHDALRKRQQSHAASRLATSADGVILVSGPTAAVVGGTGPHKLSSGSAVSPNSVNHNHRHHDIVITEAAWDSQQTYSSQSSTSAAAFNQNDADVAIIGKNFLNPEPKAAGTASNGSHHVCFDLSKNQCWTLPSNKQLKKILMAIQDGKGAMRDAVCATALTHHYKPQQNDQRHHRRHHDEPSGDGGSKAGCSAGGMVTAATAGTAATNSLTTTPPDSGFPDKQTAGRLRNFTSIMKVSRNPHHSIEMENIGRKKTLNLRKTELEKRLLEKLLDVDEEVGNGGTMPEARGDESQQQLALDFQEISLNGGDDAADESPLQHFKDPQAALHISENNQQQQLHSRAAAGTDGIKFPKKKRHRHTPGGKKRPGHHRI